MRISREKYCIVTKSYPLKFIQNGEGCDDIEEVYLTSKEDCEYVLSTFDEAEKHQIIKVNVTYEF